jgi:hypothetical protein
MTCLDVILRLDLPEIIQSNLERQTFESLRIALPLPVIGAVAR